MFSIRQFRQLNVNHIYNIFSRKSDSTITNAQWESALVVCSQIFGHSSNYFTIWKITKMLISQPNPLSPSPLIVHSFNCSFVYPQNPSTA